MFVDTIDGWVDRSKVIDKLDEHLAQPIVPDRSTWGRGAAQQQAQQALMAFAAQTRVGAPGQSTNGAAPPA